MPATSKRQFRFMQAIAHGWTPKGKKGPSKAQAKEFVAGQSPKGLPETAKSADFPLVGADKKAVRREDKVAGKPKISASTLTTDRIKEIARKQGVQRMVVKKDAGREIVESLLKAFERLDNYTLIDPREYYGALGTINNEVMKWLAPAKEMKVDESKTISLPIKGAKLKVRKVMGDMYSGWLTDKEGGIDHLFDRLTLPVLASQIMSVYEVYDHTKESPELHSLKDEIERLNGELKNAKAGGEEAKNVKERLTTIIESIDKLTAAHDKLVDRTEKEFKAIEEKREEDRKALSLSNIHSKLTALKDVLPAQEEAPAVPDTMAVRRVGMPGKCEDCGSEPCKCFSYLSKPTIEVAPSGKITIMFKSDWQDLDKTNFLKAFKYVVDKKRK